jgi:hypothetical protein
LRQENCHISGSLPDQIAMVRYSESDFGKFLYYCCRDILDYCINPDIEDIKDRVKRGKWTFIADSENRLIFNDFNVAKTPTA